MCTLYTVAFFAVSDTVFLFLATTNLLCVTPLFNYTQILYPPSPSHNNQHQICIDRRL